LLETGQRTAAVARHSLERPMEAGIDLARSQFGFTIGLHIVLAAFSIGLANYLMVLEALWLWTARQVYIDIYNYWLKPFALTFAVGAVSGIV